MAARRLLWSLKRKESEILRLNAQLEERVHERTLQLEQSNKRLTAEIQDHLQAKEHLQAYAQVPRALPYCQQTCCSVSVVLFVLRGCMPAHSWQNAAHSRLFDHPFTVKVFPKICWAADSLLIHYKSLTAPGLGRRTLRHLAAK